MEFDIKASTWDNEKREDRARIIAEEIITAIPINKKRNALEFGCGTGLVSFNLYEKFENITLVDISKGMIEMLNFKIEKHKINIENISLKIMRDEEYKYLYEFILIPNWAVKSKIYKLGDRLISHVKYK